MRKFLVLLLLLPCVVFGQAQQADHAALIAAINALGKARNDAQRDSLNTLVKQQLSDLLDTAGAFDADFSDVPITRVDAPDGKFRLFTWNVQRANGSFRYEGILLAKKHKDRILYELRDMTAHINNAATAQLSADNWYGALYYAVIPVKKGGRTYYTLLGWKGVSDVETRKVIEVLDLHGRMPRFGAPIFSGGAQRREVFAYSAQASMSLKWDAARKAIVLDHLSPIHQAFADNPVFMAPDLSFDAYRWDKGRWNLERDIDVRQGASDKPYNKPPKESR